MYLLAKKLVRALYPYGAIRTLLLGLLRGSKFVVAPSMGLTFAFGNDAMNWYFLGSKIATGDVVYDIGGNRGQMSLFFSKVVGYQGHVFSFEPVRELMDIANKNFRLNDCKNIKMHNIALADSDGVASFDFSEQLSTQGKLVDVENSYRPGHSSLPFEVPTRSLDSMMLDGSLTIPKPLKIDVEGGAGQVIEGAQNLLRDVGPEIYGELHGPEEQRSVDSLRGLGYELYDLQGNEIGDLMARWVSPVWCQKKLV